MVTRSARPTPPPKMVSPPFCGVGYGGGDWIPLPLWCGVWWPPSFFFCGGVLWWESPFLLPPSSFSRLVGGNPPPSSLWCGVWGGRVRAGKSWWARGGREASLVRQTIFCGRRFCSETLGCPFKCFGRPWRFLLGTIQHRAKKSVLMTSRPPNN